MADIFEVRWHGRGGQGTVTGAKSLAEAVQGTGKYVIAFPDYGPERRGAPLRAYNRFSDEKIRIHTAVQHPDAVIIVDPTLLGNKDVVSGIKPDTIFIVNTEKDLNEVKRTLGVVNQRVELVPANRISYSIFGREIPNSAVMGAFARACPEIITIDKLADELRGVFSHSFSAAITDKNIEAVKLGYEEGVIYERT
jgi:pyruvate ferredoxin oxidoreductase gamma subunit